MTSLGVLAIPLVVAACALEAPGDAPDTSIPTASAITTLPTFRSLDTTINGREVHPPPGMVAGDLLIAALEYDTDPVVITPPPGWTLVKDQISGAGTDDVFHALVYTHIATASEPEHFVFDAPDDVYIDIQVAAYSGVTTVTQTSGEGGFTSTIGAPPMFTTQPNQLLVAVFIGFTYCEWTKAFGMTQRSDFDANSLQDLVVPLAGASTLRRSATCVPGQQAVVNLLLR